MKVMKWFESPATLEELKAQYKKLAFAHHPDLGGSNEDMKEINAEYEWLCKELATVHKNAEGKIYHSPAYKTEAPREFIEIIEELIHMAGVEVELCGSWLWVSGNTKEHKEKLKTMKFRWSSNKSAWYYHRGEFHKKGERLLTMDEIRGMYGSERFGAMNGLEVVPA